MSDRTCGPACVASDDPYEMMVIVHASPCPEAEKYPCTRCGGKRRLPCPGATAFRCAECESDGMHACPCVLTHPSTWLERVRRAIERVLDNDASKEAKVERLTRLVCEETDRVKWPRDHLDL